MWTLKVLNGYPLVICYIAIEPMAHRDNRFTFFEDGDFQFAMLVHKWLNPVILLEGKFM